MLCLKTVKIMKIDNLNIKNSNVHFMDHSVNKEINYGISNEEFHKLCSIISSNLQLTKEIKSEFQNIANEQDMNNEKQKKFIEVLKKFGIDFAVKLTSLGVVEVLKHLLV